MIRFKVLLSYSGFSFVGSQKQVSKHTIFNAVEHAFFATFKQPVRCIPAGRTDTGVHAKEMVFHFDLPFEFDAQLVLKRLNRHLIKQAIIIRSIEPVSSDFHSLSSAQSRTYDYLFTFDNHLPHYLLDSVSLIENKPIFIPKTSELERLFLGRKNFRFLANVSTVKSTIREVYSVSLQCQSYRDLFGETIPIYCFQITANGFLYRMVRHIVGLLLHSMVNFTNMDYLKEYINIHRAMNYTLAPAEGLHLRNVNYN